MPRPPSPTSPGDRDPAAETPGELREHILRDHATLREQIDALEELARQVEAGHPERAFELRLGAGLLLDRLRRHMGFEDRYLANALRQADAWGEERAARLEADHREQRALIEDTIERINRPAPLLLAAVRDFIALLREDMREEEQMLLDPDVLRDDVVAIDTFGG